MSLVKFFIYLSVFLSYKDNKEDCMCLLFHRLSFNGAHIHS